MTYSYMAMYVLVQELHQFAGVETVLLTQVDKEFAVTFTGWRSLLLSTTITLPASSVFLVASAFPAANHTYLRCVGIVG